jgi:hypothetical protein
MQWFRHPMTRIYHHLSNAVVSVNLRELVRMLAPMRLNSPKANPNIQLFRVPPPPQLALPYQQSERNFGLF